MNTCLLCGEEYEGEYCPYCFDGIAGEDEEEVPDECYTTYGNDLLSDDLDSLS